MRASNKVLTMLLAITLSLAGCASQPEKISASNVSTLQYQSYDCQQIAGELDRIGTRVGELYAQLKKEANADAWQMGVGLLVLWPTLFLLEGGDGPEAQEYARLKGEYEALSKTANLKKCGYQVPPLADRLPKEEKVEVPAGEDMGH